MRVSSNFLEILKNFSSIYGSMSFKPGNVLRTINFAGTIMAEAVVEENIEKEFAIYDLNKLLALMTLNKQSCEIELEDDSIVVIGLEGTGKIKQRFTSKTLVREPPEGTVSMKNIEVDLILTQKVINWMNTVSSILGCPNTSLVGIKGHKISVHAMDVEGKIVDSASVVLDTVADKDFKVIFRNENLKLIPGSYRVEITSNCALFTHTERKIKYWVGIELKGSYFQQAA